MANWGLTRKQIIMLIVLVFGTFVTVLNQTVVAPALPSIMSEMSVDAAVAQWLTTGFTLVNAIMVPITAFLTDRFTTRRLFLASMVLFTAGTALAAWGPNFPVLLAGRLVQAAGAGILMPLVMTVLMWTFPVDRRGTAMGVFGIFTVVVLGNVLAFSLYMSGVPLIGPQRSSLYSFAEPVTAAIISTLVLGSPFTVWDAMGFGCIFLMLVLLSLPAKAKN